MSVEELEQFLEGMCEWGEKEPGKPYRVAYSQLFNTYNHLLAIASRSVNRLEFSRLMELLCIKREIEKRTMNKTVYYLGIALDSDSYCLKKIKYRSPAEIKTTRERRNVSAQNYRVTHRAELKNKAEQYKKVHDLLLQYIPETDHKLIHDNNLVIYIWKDDDIIDEFASINATVEAYNNFINQIKPIQIVYKRALDQYYLGEIPKLDPNSLECLYMRAVIATPVYEFINLPYEQRMSFDLIRLRGIKPPNATDNDTNINAITNDVIDEPAYCNYVFKRGKNTGKKCPYKQMKDSQYCQTHTNYIQDHPPKEPDQTH